MRLSAHLVKTSRSLQCFAGLMLASLLFTAGCKEGDSANPHHATAVPEPALHSDGPLVLIDRGHHNRHHATTTYRPFANPIQADGYRVEAGEGKFTNSYLESVDIVVVAGAMVPNERKDDAAKLLR